MKFTVCLLLIVCLFIIIWFNLVWSVSKLKEGFEAASSWKMNGLLDTYTGPYSTQNKPEPELFLFANTKSSPECCKSWSYSSADGCVCMTPQQSNFLNERGGNRTVEDGF